MGLVGDSNMFMMIIQLESEFGEKLSEIVDRNNDIPRILRSEVIKSTNCWRFIDIYGNTVFNRLQVQEFIVETEKILSSDAAKEFLSSLLQLAKQSLLDVHQYLKFIGE